VLKMGEIAYVVGSPKHMIEQTRRRYFTKTHD